MVEWMVEHEPRPIAIGGDSRAATPARNRFAAAGAGRSSAVLSEGVVVVKEGCAPAGRSPVEPRYPAVLILSRCCKGERRI